MLPKRWRSTKEYDNHLEEFLLSNAGMSSLFFLKESRGSVASTSQCVRGWVLADSKRGEVIILASIVLEGRDIITPLISHGALIHNTKQKVQVLQ